jgi:hypothetical protein
MENLLEETKNKLTVCHKTPKDVLWVGTSDGLEAITWEEFTKLADFYYDNGYGEVEIRLNLVVVGKDWWLERHEYDGSEWWEYKEHPKLQENHKGLARIKTTTEEQPL